MLGWFTRILPLSFFEALKQDLEIVENICVFTLRVTTWMMMMQRLSPGGTLDTAVSELLNGNGREILEPCRKVKEGNISANTGGYNRARQRMPEDAARRVARQSFEQLREIQSESGLRSRLFLLAAVRSGCRILRQCSKLIRRQRTSMASRTGRS